MTSQIRAWEVTDTRDQAERASERTIPSIKPMNTGDKTTTVARDSETDGQQARRSTGEASGRSLVMDTT